MSNHPRNLVAALIIVTALCADQAMIAAPTIRPQIAEQTAAQIIDRLAYKLRYAVTATDRFEDQREDSLFRSPISAIAPDDVEPSHRPTLPSFFRLPPPLV